MILATIRRYTPLIRLQIVMSFVSSAFASVLYVYFFQQHVSFSDLFFAEAATWAVGILILFFSRSFNSPHDIRLAFIVYLLSTSILLLPFTPWFLYIYFMLRGAGVVLYYVCYNSLFFQEQNTGKNMTQMTTYWALMVGIGTITPIFGGAMLEMLHMTWYAVFGILMICLGFYIAKDAPHTSLTYTRIQLLTHLRGARLIAMMDGALTRMMTVIIPVYAITYIQTNLNYGLFLSGVALVAVLFSFPLAKISDKKNERKQFIWFFSLLSGALTLLLPFTHSLVTFLIVVILLKAATTFADPLRSTILLDYFDRSHLVWTSREFYYAIGRCIASLLSGLLIVFQMPHLVFWFWGGLHILFPIVVSMKNIYATTR